METKKEGNWQQILNEEESEMRKPGPIVWATALPEPITVDILRRSWMKGGKYPLTTGEIRAFSIDGKHALVVYKTSTGGGIFKTVTVAFLEKLNGPIKIPATTSQGGILEGIRALGTPVINYVKRWIGRDGGEKS